MKERPIIFTELIPKILDGTKTHTRRVVKPQPLNDVRMISACGVWSWELDGEFIGESICPYGQVGDRFWVREKHKRTEYDLSGQLIRKVVYFDSTFDLPCLAWKPSIHMPRWASRITLEITELRVERLQEITEEDVLAEGITVMQGTWQSKKWNEKTRRLELTGEKHLYTGRYHFEVIWDSLNAKRGYPWESNPWVWVIEFKKIADIPERINNAKGGFHNE